MALSIKCDTVMSGWSTEYLDEPHVTISQLRAGMMRCHGNTVHKLSDFNLCICCSKHLQVVFIQVNSGHSVAFHFFTVYKSTRLGVYPHTKGNPRRART